MRLSAKKMGLFEKRAPEKPMSLQTVRDLKGYYFKLESADKYP